MPSKERQQKKRASDFARSAAGSGRITDLFRRPTSSSSQLHQEPDLDQDQIERVESGSEIDPKRPNPDVTVPESNAASGSSSQSQPKLANSEPSPKRRKDCKGTTVKSWGFDWLEMSQAPDGTVDLIWCKYCRKYYGGDDHEGSNKGRYPNLSQAMMLKVDAYVKGTSNSKKDTAADHQRTATHLKAVEAALPRPVPKIYRSLTTMDQETHERMQKLFRWAYTVAWAEMPFTDFPTLVRVEKCHGIDLGNTYCNDKACRLFISEIGGAMTDSLKSVIKNESTPFYCSLLFDGSTDQTTSEKEIISIKFLDNGTPKIRLLGITKPKTAKAEDIFSAITSKADEMELNLGTSCVAAAADGASVNFGRRSGVLPTLETAVPIPWLVKMHCVAHRLELALKDAFKNSFYETEIDSLMLNVYYMYKRSSKKLNELKNAGEALEEHVLKPVRSQGTRWIDHRRKALNVMNRDYGPMVSSFEEMGSEERADIPVGDRAKCRGFAKKMTTSHFVLYLTSYMDMVDELADLSMAMQSDSMPISSVRSTIEVVQASLTAMIQHPSRRLQKVMQQIEESEGDFIYKGHKLTRNAQMEESFQRKHKQVLSAVIECLNIRFSGFTDDPVLQASDIIDPANYPLEKDALPAFGVEQVRALTDHFEALLTSKGCDIHSIEREWHKLKYEVDRFHRGQHILTMWKQILTQKENKFPNILHLIRILLVIPVATAHVERQFSYIKRFLGDWRHGLALQTIEDLLRISSEGPEPENYDTTAAVDRWRSTAVHPRRPNIEPYGPRKTQGTTTDASENSRLQ